jgi:two-component system response regulator YesN
MYKLVLVEDENDVRSRIANMIEKSESSFRIVAEYTTGIDAYDGIMSDNPDLILTDIKMSFMDGIQLARMVRKSLPFVKIVFITGYSEFEYAKEAANLGVVGFINKPVCFEDLDNTLKKAEEALKEEYLAASSMEKLSAFYESNLPIIRENDLYRLSNMSVVTPAFESKLKSNGINLDYIYFMMCIFDFDTMSEGEDEGYELAFSSIKMSVKEEFEGLYDYEMFSRYEKFCLMLKSNTPPIVSELNIRFERIVQRVRRYSDIPVSVGISSIYENSRNFVAMTKEAMRALRLRSVVGGSKVFFYNDTTTASSKLSIDDKMIRELGYMMHFHSLQKCLERIDEISAHFEKAEASLFYAATSILNVLIKACDDLEGLYALHDGPDGIYARLFAIKNESETFDYLKKLTRTIAELNDGVIKDNIELNLRKIVYYMEAHFSDPDISLESLAGGVNFSVSYISVLLKKKMNTSFVKMLTEMRMEKAKVLLTDPSLKIIDVAEQLGYRDSYYFSHCFKKYAGLSPREFKNNG